MSDGDARSFSPTCAVPTDRRRRGRALFSGSGAASTAWVAALVRLWSFPALSRNVTRTLIRFFSSASTRVQLELVAPPMSGFARIRWHSKLALRSRSAPEMSDTDAVRVRPNCAVPLMVGARVGAVFVAARFLIRTRYCRRRAFESFRPSSVQIAPMALQLVVSGMVMVTARVESGSTVLVPELVAALRLALRAARVAVDDCRTLGRPA